MGKFHGIYHIKVEDNIIIVTLEGEFSEYTIKELQDKIKSIIAEFKTEPFSILIDALLFLGSTPEAYEVSNRHNHWLNSQYLLGKAHVIKQGALNEINRSYESEALSQNLREFDCVADAKKWLKSLS